jgi:hypothetical protein
MAAGAHTYHMPAKKYRQEAEKSLLAMLNQEDAEVAIGNGEADRFAATYAFADLLVGNNVSVYFCFPDSMFICPRDGGDVQEFRIKVSLDPEKVFWQGVDFTVYAYKEKNHFYFDTWKKKGDETEHHLDLADGTVFGMLCVDAPEKDPGKIDPLGLFGR